MKKLLTFLLLLPLAGCTFLTVPEAAAAAERQLMSAPSDARFTLQIGEVESFRIGVVAEDVKFTARVELDIEKVDVALENR